MIKQPSASASSERYSNSQGSKEFRYPIAQEAHPVFSLTAAQGRAKPISASSLPTCHQVTAPAEKSERLLYSRQASSDMFLLVSVAVCLTWKCVTRAVSHSYILFFLLKTKKGQAPGA